jgi:hypothetical protein
MASPSLALIGVGDGQTTGFDLPRIDVQLAERDHIRRH